MIPAGFDYLRAESLAHAVDLLHEHGDDAKILAGGHSLIPLMKFRLAAPGVRRRHQRATRAAHHGDRGRRAPARRRPALPRRWSAPRSSAEQLPLLAAAIATVGDRQVRAKATLGGGVVHGDPAADVPAVLSH